MIEVVRSQEEYRALADAALDRELERAKAGVTPSVSSKAAARFLGVHVDTLGQWRRRTPPLGPAFQKGAGDNEGGANQHVRYLISDLEEWQSARTARTVKERRLVDQLERVRQRGRELEMELELQSLREQVARMTKKAGRFLALETLRECFEVQHEWVFTGELVIGHVLSVSHEALLEALESSGVRDGTFAAAMTWPWASSEARDSFNMELEKAMTEFLADSRTQRSRQRMRDLELRLPML
ncbi:hypothetical protein [Xanthomonas cerealis]|uniref:hypothetical protein n=1 Tax=Xanthomonas cerealis TaxID=3390025 RepID=UPI0005795E8F|nr:hypothetical protein [Xanthomonas translucens]UKE46224.1 nucleotide-binding protein [Xanthomonas translucens pv. cerealis]